jgi:hypothetical protein
MPLSTADALCYLLPCLYPEAMIIQNADKCVILTGKRGPLSKLRIMDLENPVDDMLVPRQAFATHSVPVRFLLQLVQYYHQAFGCPVASIFLKAIHLFVTLPWLIYTSR